MSDEKTQDPNGGFGTSHCSTAHNEDYEDDCFEDDEHGPSCMSCCGDGYLDNVSEVSGRWGWDDDGPGPCPNCNGSGFRKDQTWF